METGDNYLIFILYMLGFFTFALVIVFLLAMVDTFLPLINIKGVQKILALVTGKNGKDCE